MESVRALTYESARRADRDGQISARDCPILKLMAIEQAITVADRCVQLTSARGVDRDAGLESAQRYLRMLRVVEGSSELQRTPTKRDRPAHGPRRGQRGSGSRARSIFPF